MRNLLPFCFFIFQVQALSAQVLVHEEPRHKPVFENAKVRLLNVMIAPGDTTLYHLHNTPSLFLFFTNTANGTQLQGGAPTPGRLTAGTILFENLAPPHQRIHRVWNADTDTFHVMDIELLGRDSGFRQPTFSNVHTTLVVDTPWVRAYRLTLEPTKTVQLKKHATNLLIIAMQAGTIKQNSILQNVDAGFFVQVAARKRWLLQNVSPRTLDFIVIVVP